MSLIKEVHKSMRLVKKMHVNKGWGGERVHETGSRSILSAGERGVCEPVTRTDPKSISFVKNARK